LRGRVQQQTESAPPRPITIDHREYPVKLSATAIFACGSGMVDQRMAMSECGKSDHGETRNRETTAGGKRHGRAHTEKMRLVVRTNHMGYSSADDFHAGGDVDHD
jgi:hypothetical protein